MKFLQKEENLIGKKEKSLEFCHIFQKATNRKDSESVKINNKM